MDTPNEYIKAIKQYCQENNVSEVELALKAGVSLYTLTTAAFTTTQEVTKAWMFLHNNLSYDLIINEPENK